MQPPLDVVTRESSLSAPVDHSMAARNRSVATATAAAAGEPLPCAVCGRPGRGMHSGSTPKVRAHTEYETLTLLSTSRNCRGRNPMIREARTCHASVGGPHGRGRNQPTPPAIGVKFCEGRGRSPCVTGERPRRRRTRPPGADAGHALRHAGDHPLSPDPPSCSDVALDTAGRGLLLRGTRAPACDPFRHPAGHRAGDRVGEATDGSELSQSCAERPVARHQDVVQSQTSRVVDAAAGAAADSVARTPSGERDTGYCNIGNGRGRRHCRAGGHRPARSRRPMRPRRSPQPATPNRQAARRHVSRRRASRPHPPTCTAGCRTRALASGSRSPQFTLQRFRALGHIGADDCSERVSDRRIELRT